MKIWDSLTPEQQAIIYIAEEAACLAYAMDEYDARLRWAEKGGTSAASELTAADKHRLVPRFVAAAEDLVARTWIEIRDTTEEEWRDAVPLSGGQLTAALTDAATWVWSGEEDRRPMLTVVTTEQWDRLRLSGA